MKVQFTHKLNSSFCLYTEHQLLNKGQAFENLTDQPLFNSTETRFQGLYNSQSPHPQWVSDSSVDNVVIPTGVSVGGNPVARGTNGLKLDFTRGRACFSSQQNNVTASYAKKDFNFYFIPEEESLLFLETLFNGEKSYSELTKANPLKIVAPCILVNERSSDNKGFSLGGEDETTTMYQATIISDNKFNVDGALSIFKDLNETTFPVVEFEDIPYDVYGDLKSGIYDYTGLYDKYTDPSTYSHIDMVKSSNIKTTSNVEAGKFYVGFTEFTVKNYRFPRL